MLQWFCHVTRKMGTLAFDIVHDSVKEVEEEVDQRERG